MAILLFGLLPTLALLSDPPSELHPHFEKKVSCVVGRGAEAISLELSHLTVTFDADGFAKMPEGQGWHLANAHLELSRDCKVGGKAVPKGRYRLLARRVKDSKWELVLDEPARFSAQFSEKAIALETEFLSEQPRHEHLRVDINPTGDKSNTSLWLEVHFDRHLARSAISLAK
jgi:hypothetical protein